MNPLEQLKRLLGGGGAAGAVKGLRQPQMKLHGMNVVNGAGSKIDQISESLRQRQPMPYAQKQPMMPQQPMESLDEYQIDQATGGRFQGGLRNIQPQAYSAQQLYRTPIGQTPTFKPQQPRFGAYMQGGGVPTFDGGNIYEDAYGGNLNDYETNRLRVR